MTNDRASGAAPAGLLLALFTASGMVPGTMLAVIVTVAKARLGFTTAQAGLLSAADIYGAAIGALAVALAGVPRRWTRAAAMALAATIAIDLLSTMLTDFAALFAARLVRGMAGGVVMGLGYAAIGRARSPDRLFGALLVCQFVIGGLGIALLPAIVIARGTWLLFLIYAGLNAIMLAALPLLRQPDLDAPARTILRVGIDARLATALLALAAFQAAHTAGAAYVLEIARTAGIALPLAQKVTGLAGMAGAAGALAIAAIGVPLGRVPTTLIASIIGIIGNLLILPGAPLPFTIGIAIGAFAWGASIPLVLALCATADRAGRGAAWASFAAKLGLASGPVLGAMVVSGTNFTPAIWLACALSAGAAMLLWRTGRG